MVRPGGRVKDWQAALGYFCKLIGTLCCPTPFQAKWLQTALAGQMVRVCSLASHSVTLSTNVSIE